MESAIEETKRRRRIQRAFNEEHGHEPATIDKEVGQTNLPGSETETGEAASMEPDDAEEAARAIAELEARMEEAADNLEFELAADIRDRIRQLRQDHDLDGGDAEGVPAPDIE